MQGAFSRRTLLRGTAGLGLAGLLPAGVLAEVLAGCGPEGEAGPFDEHQRAVITEATARLIPGPTDDPGEAGHPGAREANVTGYITVMIGAMAYQPPKVFAGGPFSDRSGHATDQMATFLEPNRALAANWRLRLQRLHAVYLEGIAAFEASARRLGGSTFLTLSAADKDIVLAANPKVRSLPSSYDGFTDLLFEHAIEGMYSVPEYGGNSGTVAWKDIGFPGDVQPTGYTDAQVSQPLDTAEYSPTPAVVQVLQLLESTAPKPPASAG
jgi:hypothetical protein